MKTTICCIVKNEHNYIVEWVEHYLNLGFDSIYVFEDFGSNSHKDVLNKYINAGSVILIPLENNTYGITKGNCISGNQTQGQVYKFFQNYCRENNIADWVGFFDVDEFLQFQDGYDLDKVLNEFADYNGILVSWVLYGANGHIKKPIGNVVDNYTKHVPLNVHLDGIRFSHKTLLNVHKKSNMVTIHEWTGCVCTDLMGDFNHVCYDKLYLSHYFTKSFEEYCERMLSRGNMANYRRSFDQFFYLSPELSDREKELIDSIRFDTYNCDVHWISKKHKLIAGGNTSLLSNLRNSIK